MNKIKIIIIALFGFACQLIAQEKQDNKLQTNTTLQHANVYFGNGVELTHAATVTVNKGYQEIVFNNVSVYVDNNTIQISASENITILSYRHYNKIETNTTTHPLLPRVQDSLKQANKQLLLLQQEYALQEELLKKSVALIEGFNSSSNKNINAPDVMKLVDFYTAKVQQYKLNMYSSTNKIAELSELITFLNQRIYQLTNEGNKTISKANGQLIVQVMAQKSEEVKFDISYYTPNAGWTPSYEMRVKTIDNSFKLGYKALVFQSTGIDWKQIPITLSTSNPNQTNTTPLLQAWYLQQYVPQLYGNIQNAKKLSLMNSVQTLNEVVVTSGYSARSKDKEAEKSDDISNYLQVNESQLYTSFDIDLPYVIPADGTGYSVNIKEEDIKATYKHYAVPKLDKDAFLMAEISDWENLDLLPGQANIIMDGKYIGKSFIDPNSTLDTLNINLGRDKRVSIKRTSIKNTEKVKTKGDNKIETFAYEIVVKNNKKQLINLLLKDQYPLSKDKEIEINLINETDADINEELGILNWKLSIPAGESKSKQFGYTVKYPKTKVIGNLR
ncbi:MAG: DUF4139 domain-containing protein [Chitinophagaceae bacterium]